MRFNDWLTWKESEQNMPQLPDAKKVMYTACVLNKFSQTELITAAKKWMFEATGSGIPPGWIGRAHHMTVKFSPNQLDIEAIASMLGKEVDLTVTNWAYDDYCIAVVVKAAGSLPLNNAVSHITLAHSREVGAVYSNTLLQDRSKWLPQHMVLKSELVCVLRDNVSTIPTMVNPASPSF